MPAFGGGGTLITMPTSPVPKSIEVQDVYIAGANTAPFSGQQQTQDWQSRYTEASVSYPSMTQAKAQIVIAFLKSLNGIVNVFQFPGTLCSKYPESLTSDGTTPRYWRLKGNVTKWSIKPGAAYPPITFEIREAT